MMNLFLILQAASLVYVAYLFPTNPYMALVAITLAIGCHLVHVVKRLRKKLTGAAKIIAEQQARLSPKKSLIESVREEIKRRESEK